MMEDDSFGTFLFCAGGGENDGEGKLGWGENLDVGSVPVFLKLVCSGVNEIETARLHEGGK